ncbi:hypothetical protein CYY_004325 [Polysphondylium violaceum]|uniref:Pleckstrin domain-containing protein n=1 Tax=Polysphondylium violaceum TaxID=133409 RepID=A0A8J4PYE4_9MYCE|nr:hypothetical protein CYY_004325 [Polysphondylium violaceum]
MDTNSNSSGGGSNRSSLSESTPISSSPSTTSTTTSTLLTTSINNTNGLRKSNTSSLGSNSGAGFMQSCMSFLLRSLTIKKWIEKLLQEEISKDDQDDDVLLFKDLKDGIILCRLMSAIKPDSIPKIHTGTNILNFKIRENIYFFSQALDEIGVSRHFQFSVADLLERKNLLKVLESLEVLADIAMSEYEKPIDQINDDETHFTEKQISLTETILKKLNANYIKRQPLKKLTTNEPKRFTTNLGNSITGPTTSTTGSKLNVSQSKPMTSRITSTPSNIKPKAIQLSPAQIIEKAKPFEKKWIRIQSIIRGHLTRRAYQKRVRFAAYRHNIVKELLATETVYVESLEHALVYFLNPIREESLKLNIKSDQFGLFISNLEVIINYNKNLLEKIKPKVDNWSYSQTIGDVFEQFTLYLKVYTQYVKEYSTLFEAINNLRKNNSKFESFISEKEYSDKPVGSYLILPIQRIPRYTLLLQDLVKNTWSDHLDYKNLTESLKKMQEVATYVNEKKREAENIAKVTEIQNNFIGKFDNLAEPHRRFVFEGNLSVINPNGKESQRVIFLFNDVLIGTKPITSGLVKKKVSLKVKESIRMNLITVRDNSNSNSNSSSSSNGSNSNQPTRITSNLKSNSTSSLINVSSNNNNNNSSSLSSSCNNASNLSTNNKPPVTNKPVPPPRSQATFNVAVPNTTNATPPKTTIGLRTQNSETTTTTTTTNSKPRSQTVFTPSSKDHPPVKMGVPTPITASASLSQERLLMEERKKKQELIIELVDTFGTCILKLLCSTPKEKEQWVNEIKKVHEDIDNRKMVNDDAMKRSQERAGLAKAALSQQYATLRVKGRLYDLSSLKTIVSQEEEDGNSDNGLDSSSGSNNSTPNSNSPNLVGVNNTGERDFQILRRQTIRRSQNPTSKANEGESSASSPSGGTVNSGKMAAKSKEEDSMEDKKGTIGSSWFSSLRKKKKPVPSIQETFGHLETPISPPQSPTLEKNSSNNSVILKQEN